MAGEIIEINPCSKDFNSTELFELLKSNPDQTFFEGEYRLSNGKTYKFKHPLLKRIRYISLQHPQIKYDVLSATPIATGYYGVVYHVYKTITMGKNSLRLKTDNNHIVKMTYEQAFKKDNIVTRATPRESIEREHRFLKMGERFHPKQIQLQYGRTTPNRNFITTRKFKGITLRRLLAQNNFDIEKKLRLSIALLRALKNQIHELGLIHRDIKPDNIIVDIETMEINFIDLGLSVEEKKHDRKAPGTPTYGAPELIDGKKKYGKEVDVFSLGRVLAEIWDDNSAIWHLHPESRYKYYKSFSKTNLFIRNENNDQKYNEMNDYAKNTVADSIDNALKVNPDERNSIDSLITQFHGAYIAECYRNSDPEILSNSFKQGLNARNQLIKSNNMAEFYNKLNATLDTIEDSESSIKEFTHGLGFASIKNATNKEEVTNLTRTLIDEFDIQIRKYNALYSQAAVFMRHYAIISNTAILSDLKEFLLELKHKANIINQRPYDLDLLQRTSETLALRYKYWNNRLNEINRHLDTDEDFSRIKENIYALGNKVVNKEKKKVENQPLQIIDHNYLLNSLKELLRNALRKYMRDTLTKDNITKKDRAASERRQADIRDFRNIIDDNDNINKLKEKTIERMDSIDTGFFGRSELRSRLKEALEKHKTQIQSYRTK